MYECNLKNKSETTSGYEKIVSEFLRMKMISKFLESTKKTEASSKKYEFTGSTVEYDGLILYQIRAVRDIRSDVLSGDIGGFIQLGNNLSDEGSCWVGQNAMVYGCSRVQNDALVEGTAIVKNSFISENAKVSGSPIIVSSSIRDDASVDGSATVIGANLYDCSHVGGCAKVHQARLYDAASVSGFSTIDGEEVVLGGCTEVKGHSKITGIKLLYDKLIYNKVIE